MDINEYDNGCEIFTFQLWQAMLAEPDWKHKHRACHQISRRTYHWTHIHLKPSSMSKKYQNISVDFNQIYLFKLDGMIQQDWRFLEITFTIDLKGFSKLSFGVFLCIIKNP